MGYVQIKTDFVFKDDRIDQVFAEINEAVMDWLEDSGQILEDGIEAYTAKRTGETALSWYHETKREGAGLAVCEVKSEHPNASFEEFGTGVYAEVGHYPSFKGKIPWKYQDESGEWHTTTGKRARKPARAAIDAYSPIIAANAQRIL